MDLIPCPLTVIKAGAQIVKGRHQCKSWEDAEKVGGAFRQPDWDGLFAAVHAAMVELHAVDPGIRQSAFGPGLLHLKEAQHGPEWKRYEHLNCAHECFALLLDARGIATPTDKQIAAEIGVLNWR